MKSENSEPRLPSPRGAERDLPAALPRERWRPLPERELIPLTAADPLRFPFANTPNSWVPFDIFRSFIDPPSNGNSVRVLKKAKIELYDSNVMLRFVLSFSSFFFLSTTPLDLVVSLLCGFLK